MLMHYNQEEWEKLSSIAKAFHKISTAAILELDYQNWKANIELDEMFLKFHFIEYILPHIFPYNDISILKNFFFNKKADEYG